MPMLNARDLRRGDTILTADGNAPREIMKVSSEAAGIWIDGRHQTISITEIKFTDGTKVLTAPESQMPVMTRFGMAGDA